MLAVVEDGARGRARGAGRDAATERSQSRVWPVAARGRHRGGFGGVAELWGEDNAALIGVHATKAEGAMRVPGRGACSPGDGGGAPGSQGARAWSMEARQGLGEEGASHGLVDGRGGAHQQWRWLGNGGEGRRDSYSGARLGFQGQRVHPRRPCPQRDTRRWIAAHTPRGRGQARAGARVRARRGGGGSAWERAWLLGLGRRGAASLVGYGLGPGDLGRRGSWATQGASEGVPRSWGWAGGASRPEGEGGEGRVGPRRGR